MQRSLFNDYGLYLPCDNIKEKIKDEVYDNVVKYRDFHTGRNRDTIEHTNAYLDNKQYTIDIVDVIIPACAEALKVNIFIFQKDGEATAVIRNMCTTVSLMHVFLKYHRSGGSNHTADHYSSIADILQHPFPIPYNPPPLTEATNNNVHSQNSSTNLYTSPQPHNSSSNNTHNSTINPPHTTQNTNYTIITSPTQPSTSQPNTPIIFAHNEPDNPDLIENEIRTAIDEDCMEAGPGKFFDEFGELINFNTSRNLENDPDPQCENNNIEMSDDDVEISLPGPDVDVPIVPEPIDLDDPIPIPEEFNPKPRSISRKHAKPRFNYSKFEQMEGEKVERIPWTVNGDKKFHIQCTENEYNDMSQDGRWWDMHTSSRVGFNGRVKTGVCLGSLICHNNRCPKLTTEGVCNTSEFGKDSGAHVCRSCGFYALRIHCGCRRVVQYNRDTSILTVMYSGDHICIPKPNLKTKVNYIKHVALNLDPLTSRPPTRLLKEYINSMIAKGQLTKAIQILQKIDDKTLLERMRYVLKDDVLSCTTPEDEALAFSNLRELKKQTDKVDNFLIYDMKCEDVHGGRSYAFKSCRQSLEIALKMDARWKGNRGRPSLLCREKAFFDGMHSRCVGYKTLTLFAYHIGMCRMQRIASMEVKKEDKESVELFFTVLNKALAELTGDPTYKFNPHKILCDEKGSNINGIISVLGPKFAKRVMGCQWHFKQCAWRQLKHIDESDRETFKKAVHGLCYAPCEAEYKKYAASLEAICRRNNCIRWYNWWKVRRFHIVQGLRGYGWTGTNWAEIGQSSMRDRNVVYKMWLLKATWEDIGDALLQTANYRAFIRNRGKTIGKGPTLWQQIIKDRKEQKRFLKAIIDALVTDDVADEARKHRDADSEFIPSSKAKHRVPRKYPVTNPEQRHKKQKQSKPKRSPKVTQPIVVDNISSGTEADIDDEDIINSENPAPPPANATPLGRPRRRNPDRKRRGQNRKYMSSPESSCSETEKLKKTSDLQVPQDVEEKHMLTNPPTYVRLGRADRCQGCRIKFTDRERKPPQNLIFRFLAIREYPVAGQQGVWRKTATPQPCYYHALDYACLRRQHGLECVNDNDIYIQQATFQTLSHEDNKLLDQRGHLTPLLRNRLELIKNKTGKKKKIRKK